MSFLISSYFFGGDPFFENVASLLHFDGPDASTVFTDEIGSSWSASGNAQIDTGSPILGGGSLLLDGSGDLISTASNGWIAGTQDFTVEISVNFDVITGEHVFYAEWGVLTANASLIFRYSNSNAGIRVSFTNTSLSVTSFNYLWSPSVGVDYRIALVRSGSNVEVFVEGVSLGSNTYSDSINSTTEKSTIGGYISNTDILLPFRGYIDEFRVTSGIARYSSSYTPTDSPFPNG